MAGRNKKADVSACPVCGTPTSAGRGPVSREGPCPSCGVVLQKTEPLDARDSSKNLWLLVPASTVMTISGPRQVGSVALIAGEAELVEHGEETPNAGIDIGEHVVELLQQTRELNLRSSQVAGRMQDLLDASEQQSGSIAALFTQRGGGDRSESEAVNIAARTLIVVHESLSRLGVALDEYRGVVDGQVREIETALGILGFVQVAGGPGDPFDSSRHQSIAATSIAANRDLDEHIAEVIRVGWVGPSGDLLSASIVRLYTYRPDEAESIPAADLPLDDVQGENGPGLERGGDSDASSDVHENGMNN